MPSEKDKMAKYRLLSSDELKALEKEFVEYLVVNGITADEWERLKKEENDKAKDPIPNVEVKSNEKTTTKTDDKPPTPLNRATISGIEVISTFFAAIPPIKPPTTIPAIISSKFKIFLSNKVTATPISIATAAI